MRAYRFAPLAIAAALACSAAAQAQTVKIGYIDPLSGPFANVGEQGLKHFQYVIDDINARNLTGGPKLEVVALDNKGTPQESLNQLKVAIDRGIRIVTQGNGSGAALAISDAVAKNNERNPAQSVIYFNYAAVDPDLTNGKCNFWHFRFDANSEMKLEAITEYIRTKPQVKNVYLINQNYAHGQQVSRIAKEFLARKRPDIKIVGDDLHPFGQVKDFAPYVAKIKASGADTVITGNWGNDMSLLTKAAKDAGLNVDFYTYYAGGLGTPTAMGEAAAGHVKQISEWHSNVVPNKTEKFANAFHAKYGLDYYYLRIGTELYMLADAIKRAKSADPLRIAYALEGAKYMSDTGEVEMRARDHQLLTPMYLSTIYKDAAKGGDKEIRHDVENTGMGFKTDVRFEPYVMARPTTCEMQRPPKP
ncbi:MAG TPA: branched-chain amino acid ABC transporter substrate-binding protein [Burkholderiales bacterium]|jgi:branched-chain amino acid transport system substrate-binding protein|nr:branched-chain amino acid ABC transporter substrate-binding protein [Burkholderiales bacterium]